MRKWYLIVSLCLLAASCQYFSTEKKSREDYFREEVANIDWEDVDSYPLLSTCSELDDKMAQRQCFATEVSRVVQILVDDFPLMAGESFKDTVKIEFFVSEQAEMLITEVQVAPALLDRIPELESTLLGITDSIDIVEPAHKRGIPVRMQFTLPVVVRSQGL